MVFPSNGFDPPPGTPRRDPASPGARMVRYHAHWLSLALRSHRAFPRIPMRMVSEGGFSALLASPDGRRTAETWWVAALETTGLSVDELESLE